MIPIAAITDEFSPDLETALEAMSTVGMTGAELRVINGKNVVELTDDEIDRARAAVEARGMTVMSIASPVLKCVLPDSPPPDRRFQQDIFGSAYTMADQPRITARAFEVARRTGARIIRVFSYWRSEQPERCTDRVIVALRDLADRANDRGVIIGLENEGACMVGTGAEAAAVLAAVEHPALQLVWDPANAYILGEVAYPAGYDVLPSDRIVHVHAKDCKVSDFKPEWGALGDMDVDWPGQIRALVADGYRGWISLETHWKGPRGDKMEASLICGARLRDLVAAGTRP